jgi:hypothetical protein
LSRSSSDSGVVSNSGWAAVCGAVEFSRIATDPGGRSPWASDGLKTMDEYGVDFVGWFDLRFFFRDLDKGIGGGAPGTIRRTPLSGILVSGDF